MNTPVKFELAKLLKEKEFNEPCSHHLINNKSVINFGSKRTSEAILEDLDKDTTVLALPTIAEVCMWLYEKHGIWIWAGVRENDDKQLVFIPNGRNIPIKKDKNGNTIDCIQYSVHKTPTEAYEAAIDYTLNNLI